MNISGKSVLVTGANRGIGRALVDEALKRGAIRVYAGVRKDTKFNDSRVTSVILDVTNDSHIKAAVAQIESLDVLINNAGIALYDDPGNIESIQKQFDVNLFGLSKVTHAFLPHLKRSKGAILNNLSMAGIGALPIIPGYSMSKAAAFNMTQSLRAIHSSQGVSVHAVFLGPIDTDMNRGFDIPKATTEMAARGIFDGLQRNEEEIFPDPASQSIAEGWRNGVAKGLEKQFAGFVPPSTK